MSFLSKVKSFFASIVHLAHLAFDFAKVRGLTDEIVAMALVWLRVAERKFVDNAEKREWVVNILVGKGIPESIARLALELAVQVFKAELEPRVVG